MHSVGASTTASQGSDHKSDRKTPSQRLIPPIALRSAELGPSGSRRRGATDALVNHAMASGRGKQRQEQAARSTAAASRAPLRSQPVPGVARRGARMRSARAHEMAVSLMQQQPSAASAATTAASASTRGRAGSGSLVQLVRRTVERFAPEIGNELVVDALVRSVQVASWSTYLLWLRKRCSECNLMSLYYDIVPDSAARQPADTSRSRPFMTQIDVSGRLRTEACVELMDRASVKQPDGTVKRTYNAHMFLPEGTALQAQELQQLVSLQAYKVPAAIQPLAYTVQKSPEVHAQMLKLHASVLQDAESGLRPRYRHPFVSYGAAEGKIKALHDRWGAAAAQGDHTQGTPSLRASPNTEDVAQSESLQTSRQSQGELHREDAGKDAGAAPTPVASPTAADSPSTCKAEGGAATAVDSTMRPSVKETQAARTQAATALQGSMLGKTWAPSAARTEAASAPVRAAPTPRKTSQTRTTKYCELCRLEYEVVDGNRGVHFASSTHQRRLNQAVLPAASLGVHQLVTAIAPEHRADTPSRCKHCSVTCRFVQVFVAWQVQMSQDTLAHLQANGTGNKVWDLRPESLKRVACNAVFQAVDAWTHWARQRLCGVEAAAPGDLTALVADRVVFWTLCLRSGMGSSPHPSTIMSLLGELQPVQLGEDALSELPAELRDMMTASQRPALDATHSGCASPVQASVPATPLTPPPMYTPPRSRRATSHRIALAASAKSNPAATQASTRDSGDSNSNSSSSSGNSSSSTDSRGVNAEEATIQDSATQLDTLPRAEPDADATAAPSQDTAQTSSQGSSQVDPPSHANASEAPTDVEQQQQQQLSTVPSPARQPRTAAETPLRRSPRRSAAHQGEVKPDAPRSSGLRGGNSRRFSRWCKSGMLSPMSAAAKHSACSSLPTNQRVRVSQDASSNGKLGTVPPPPPQRQGALVASASGQRSSSITRGPRLSHRAPTRAVVVSATKRRRQSTARSLQMLTQPSAVKLRRASAGSTDTASARRRRDSFDLPASPGGSPFRFAPTSPTGGAPASHAQESLRITRRRISAARGRDLASPPRAF